MHTPVWDDATWSPLPALSADAHADVCVIGLGASGLCAVLEVLALGRSVIGIDATVTAGGAAGANGGVLRAGVSRFHHEAATALGRERARDLYQLTAAEIDRIAQETPGALRRTGSLRVADDEAEWSDIAAQFLAMRADGIDVEERETTFGRGLFVPHDAALQPVVRARALAHMALDRGARLFERTPAANLVNGAVITPGGRIRCGAIVITVDGGLEEFVPMLADVARTTRLQMLATEPATDVSIPCPLSMRGGFDYAQQLPDGRVVLGGGRNRALEREWGAAAEPSSEIQSYLDTVLRDRIGTTARVTHRWAARAAYTETTLPVLEEIAPQAWATGAYNGTGNLLGAIFGRAAARLACGELRAIPPLLARERSTAVC